MTDRGSRGTRAGALEVFGATLVFCLGMAIFYREPIFSGFAKVFGDKGDARFYIFHFEHWYQVFAGHARMADTPMFYPTTGALGFADAQFLQALPYALFKKLGADWYVSYQLTLFTQSLIGFVSMYALARYLFRAPWWLAMGAAFAVAFANGVHGQAAHAQIFALNYYPVILLFLVGAAKRLRENALQAAILAAGGGLSLAATFFTGYYMAFFFVLLSLSALLLYLVFDWRQAGAFLRQYGRRTGLVAGTGLIACLIGLIPFFSIYLPVVLSGARRGFAEVMHYAPTLADLLNVGSGNLLWGWLPQTLTSLSEQRLRYGEATMAPTPLLVLGSIALWLWLLRRDRPLCKRQLRLTAALFFAGGILLVMTVNFDGTSGWWLVWKLVPGGSGLRVPFRIGISYAFVLVLIIVILGSALLRTAVAGNVAWRRGALAALAVLIAAGQINLQSTSRLDRVAQNAWIRKLPPPPRACRSFVAIDTSFKPVVSIYASLFLQVDAMLIAAQTGLPTINGYSSVAPPHWNMLRPDQRKFVENAKAWISRHKLQDGICVYDRGRNSWSIGVGKLN